MYDLFAEHLQIDWIMQDSPVIFVTNWLLRNLLVENWIQSLDPRDSPENLKCKFVITVHIVVEFHSTGHKIMWVNDFFLVKAFALSDKLDGAIISAIN